MIARIRFEVGGNREEAVLGDDLVWTCSDQTTADTLNTLIEGADRSPALGDWRAWHAAEMAEMLQGEIEYEPKEQAPPGTVY